MGIGGLIDVPERFTQFLLEAGQKKITWELDTREYFLQWASS